MTCSWGLFQYENSGLRNKTKEPSVNSQFLIQDFSMKPFEFRAILQCDVYLYGTFKRKTLQNFNFGYEISKPMCTECFSYDLFNYTLSGCNLANREFKRLWKEVVMAYLRYYPSTLPEETKKTQDIQRFEQGASQIWSKHTDRSAGTFSVCTFSS